ncbi:hypothetical protein ETD86_48025 [Nonomuraea turkmeniaca]|uniref:TIGR04222 domain-containing membrane protein n=1 Tax=Nonomuraea turkmeniaca TaxID=103838 RepID=A0A5S4EXY6_9ACTN|nr:hypothetical protein [Nonomuraea turkmeniaca]TMR08385.1 hypothetical protein ETD86_48025 [Nonomuraea turkmeniaca]
MSGAAFVIASLIKHEHIVLDESLDVPLVSSATTNSPTLREDRSRVADTAIALLAESGELRVSRGRRVHRMRSRATSQEPLAVPVLDAVASRSELSVAQLRMETMRALSMAAFAGCVAVARRASSVRKHRRARRAELVGVREGEGVSAHGSAGCGGCGGCGGGG